MGGRGSGQHNSHFCAYQVAEILDKDRLPVYVTMQRAGESFIELAWSCRHLVENPLMAWLRTIGRSAAIPRAARQGRATAPAGRVATHAVPPGRDCANGRQLAERAGLRFMASATSWRFAPPAAGLPRPWRCGRAVRQH